MKKLFYSVVVIALAVMLPLTANAATITATTKSDNGEVTVDEIVEITVQLNEDEVESMQFDLEYDATKFTYVPESAKSDLNSTLSNEIKKGLVRVSVLDNGTDTKTTDKVNMQFKAIEEGAKSEFKIVDGSIEIGKGEEVTSETAANPTVTIEKIIKKETVQGEVVPVGAPAAPAAPVYVDAGGQPIAALPDTGDDLKVVKAINGVYDTLGNMKNVVLYAFSTSDDKLEVDDLKAEFGNNIIHTINGIVKTGDTFTANGTTYNIIIYGDVNGDGIVSTFDALLAKKIKLGQVSADNEYCREAANIEELAINTVAMQKFILQLRQTATDTILDQFPVKNTKKVEAISVVPVASEITGYCQTPIPVARLKATTPDDVKLTGISMASTVTKDGVEVSNVLSYMNNNGEYTINLTVADPGTYKVSPKVNIDGTILVDTDDTVNTEIEVIVSHDFTLDYIEVYNGDTPVNGAIDLLAGSDLLLLNIKYYNRYGLELTPDNGNAMQAAKVTLVKEENQTVLNNGGTSLRTKSGGLVTDESSRTEHIDKLAIQTIENVNGSTVLKINYDGTTKKEIVVNVILPEITGIKIGKTRYTGAEDESLDINMYTSNSNADDMRVFTVDNEVGNYTIIDFNLTSQFYDNTTIDVNKFVNIKNKNVKKFCDMQQTPIVQGMAVNELGNDYESDINIKIVGLKKNNSDEYVVASEGDNIIALGISFSSMASLLGGPANVAASGINLCYDFKADGTSKILKLNVTVDPAEPISLLALDDFEDEGFEEEESFSVMSYAASLFSTFGLNSNNDDDTNTNTNANVVGDENTNTNVNTNVVDTNTVNTNTNTDENTNTVDSANNTVEDNTVVCTHDDCEFTSIKKATCTEKGEKTGTCKKCGEPVTIVIDELDHEYGENGICKAINCNAVKEQTTVPEPAPQVEENTVNE